MRFHRLAKITPLPCLMMFGILVLLACTVHADQKDVEQEHIELGEEKYIPLDVPYVQTHEDVVARMLDLAKITKDDVIYDLGCGDGRIVIMAAKKYGTRGVGIDLDPARIKEANENAKKANVSERVTFLNQNIFDTDFSEATVLTMYLLSSVNLKLRPQLFIQLKPGTRVVSHAFSMADWKPDQVVSAPWEDISSTVYFWIIPANVEGNWAAQMASKTNEQSFGIAFEQEFQQLSGTVTMGDRKFTIDSGKMTGKEIAFEASHTETKGRIIKRTTTETLRFSGQVDGNLMSGDLVVSGGNWKGKNSWEAAKIRK